MNDPRADLIVTGAPVPHPEYHHNGAQTSNASYTGGTFTVEVGNPSVDHPGNTPPYEFVVDRILKDPAVDWIEIGWAEVSWKSDTRFVYTFTSASGAWTFHTAYPVTDGSYYDFQLSPCLGGAGKCAYINWGGTWVQLRSSGNVHCLCGIEQYLEIYSEDSTPHPAISAPTGGPGVNVINAGVRTAAGVWLGWEDFLVPSFDGVVSPYNVCWTDEYYLWRAGKDLTC